MTDASNHLLLATSGASAIGRSIPLASRATYDVTPVEIVSVIPLGTPATTLRVPDFVERLATRPADLTAKDFTSGTPIADASIAPSDSPSPVAYDADAKGVLIQVASPVIAEENALAGDASPGEEVEVALANVTPAQALEHVLAAERREIEFDRSTADAVDRLHYDGLLSQLGLATWSKDASGTLFLPSIWDGGIDEEGTEWRFIPVSVAASVAV